MRKRFVKVVLFGALALATTTSFISCKDYDDDIKRIDNEIGQINKSLDELKASVGNNGIKSVTYDAATGKLTIVDANDKSSSCVIAQNLPEYTVEISGGKVILKKNGQEVSSANLPAATAGFDPAKLTINTAGEVLYDGTKTGVTVPTNSIALIEKDGVVVGYTFTINGKEYPFYIADALPLTSLVFQPEAYLSGVEAMSAKNITYNAWTVNKSDKPATEIGEIWNAPTATVGNISPYLVAQYHLNPSTVSAKQFSKENLRFIFDDKEYVGTRAAKFNPEVIDFTVENGILSVTLNVTSEEIQKINADKISVLALQATVSDGKVVTSDYAGIYKSIIKDLVIAKKGATVDTHLKGADGALVGQAVAAIGTAATVVNPEYTLAYNDTKGLDISTLIETHCQEYKDKKEGALEKIGTEKTLDATMLAKYGMKYVYSLSNYYQGTNKTEQNDFANLTAEGVLTAKVFSATGDPYAAVGRMPVVRVELVDVKTNNVINAGWIKVKIIKDKTAAGTWTKDFNAFALQCTPKELDVTVEEMNVNIYNKLGLSKAEFHALYTLKAVNGLAVLANPTDNGMVQEIVDPDGNKETTILKWTLPSNEVLADVDGQFAATITYAAKDADSRGDFTVTFKASVEKPTAKFEGKKIDEYWFENMGTIKVNTEIPGTLTDKCAFYSDYDNVFVGNMPKYSVSGATLPVSDDFAPARLGYHYEFTSTNSSVVVAGYTLSASADGKDLWATKGANTAIIATLKQENKENKENGVVTYQENDIAKTVLNAQVGFSAKVGIYVTNGCYKMPAVDGGFNSMFLRPVNIEGDGTKFFVDANNSGSTLNVLELVNLKDWREKTELNSFKLNPSYYNYYEVKSIKVDIAKVTCDLAGGNLDTQLLSDVTTQIKLDASNPTPGKPAIAGPAAEYYGTVTYTNNTNNVQAFKLKIPVTVSYKWGDVTEKIVVEVRSTSSGK